MNNQNLPLSVKSSLSYVSIDCVSGAVDCDSCDFCTGGDGGDDTCEVDQLCLGISVGAEASSDADECRQVGEEGLFRRSRPSFNISVFFLLQHCEDDPECEYYTQVGSTQCILYSTCTLDADVSQQLQQSCNPASSMFLLRSSLATTA